MPVSEVHTQLQSGELQQVSVQWQGLVRQLFALCSRVHLLNAKAKCLKE
ncbi:MAG: hypothetical protein OFPI_39610 [Osedax symbiont Rs2]|nr:MAG: hypothetical protein OFPI_39610 [Osedax symbiont Rs2]